MTAASTHAGVPAIRFRAGRVARRVRGILFVAFGLLSVVVAVTTLLVICAPLNLSLPSGKHIAAAASEAAGPLTERGGTWIMIGLASVFTATWFGSTAMAAHLPRLLQEAGASLPAAIAAAVTRPTARVRPPAASLMAVRESAPLTAKPCDRAEATFAAPRAAKSWSGSTSFFRAGSTTTTGWSFRTGSTKTTKEFHYIFF